jgi:hypothetical protein
MKNLNVAVEAFHLMLGHMRLMQELCLSIAVQAFGLVVAGIAALLGDLPIAFDHPFVTESTVHIKALDFPVVKGKAGGGDHLLGHFMAEDAAAGSLVEGIVLEVAEKAGAGGDRDVTTLHDLGVATGTAQLLLSAHLGQVGPVVKEDIVVDLPTEQHPFLMTAATQAALVIHLGPRIGGVGPGKIARHHGHGLIFFAHLRSDPGWDVALNTGDVFVGRA